MKKNVKTKKPALLTAEGAKAVDTTLIGQLRRSVLSCMLWEDSFYEDGVAIAERIKTLVHKCDPIDVSQLAIEARSVHNLRHVPLWLTRSLVDHPDVLKGLHRGLIRLTLSEIIQRPDELGEFISLYWLDGKKMLPNQVKLGLADALGKFNEYQLAKYSGKHAEVRLRDVLFLTHATPPKGKVRLYKKLADDKLATPDTWEVAITAAGSDLQKKTAEWTRLVSEDKLGALALLRNLRNMSEANVPVNLVKTALKTTNIDRVLPFRFVEAAAHAPQFAGELEDRFLDSARMLPKLPGHTVLVVDVSGSMYGSRNVSSRSRITRIRAACALAAIVREACESATIYATAGSDSARIHQTKLVPARRGFALVDAIEGMCEPLGGGGIFLNQVMKFLATENLGTVDRTIVITDEQDCAIAASDKASLAKPIGKGYLLNVSVERNGIGYKPSWTHVDGFSEAVLGWIAASE